MSHIFKRAKLAATYIHPLNHNRQLKQLYTNKYIVSRFQSFHYRSIININITNIPNKYVPFGYRKLTTNAEEQSTPQQLTREHLQRSFRRAQRWFTIRILTMMAAIIGVSIYCWDHPNDLINLKNKVSKIFSDVGTSTLSQKELQIQATQYSKQMICDVFNDENMQKETKQFFISILSQPDFLETISRLLSDLFRQDIMIESVKKLIINVFNDPLVMEQCKILVGRSISAEENKQILLKTLHEIFDDVELNKHMKDVANDTVKCVLDDEDIKILSIVFLKNLLNDNSIQQSSSESLYKVFVGAMTPNVFKKKKTQNMMVGEYDHEDDVEEHGIEEVTEFVDSIESVIGNL